MLVLNHGLAAHELIPGRGSKAVTFFGVLGWAHFCRCGVLSGRGHVVF